MRTQKVVSDTQFGILVAYMEKNKKFAMFRLRSSSALEKRHYGEQWEKLATTLNSVGATNKTPAKWKDYWNEKKYAVRKKAFELTTKGGKLTPLEERVLNICGQMTVTKVRMPAQNGKAASLRPKAAHTPKRNTACASTSTDSPPTLLAQKAQTVDVTTSPLSPNHLSWSTSSSEYAEPYFRKCTCEYCLPEPTPPPPAESDPQATKRPSPSIETQSGSAKKPKVAVADSKCASTTFSPASPSPPPPQLAHHTPVVDSRTPPVTEQSQNQDTEKSPDDFDERMLQLKEESMRALRDIADVLARGLNIIGDYFNTMAVIQSKMVTIESYMASTTHSLARIEMVLESTLGHLRHSRDRVTYYRE